MFTGRIGYDGRPKSGVLRGALVLILLLAALLAGARGDSASLPVKAVRWFLGLDEADKFALPLQPTGNISDP
jgi:hypothetical protein